MALALMSLTGQHKKPIAVMPSPVLFAAHLTLKQPPTEIHSPDNKLNTTQFLLLQSHLAKQTSITTEQLKSIEVELPCHNPVNTNTIPLAAELHWTPYRQPDIKQTSTIHSPWRMPLTLFHSISWTWTSLFQTTASAMRTHPSNNYRPQFTWTGPPKPKSMVTNQLHSSLVSYITKWISAAANRSVEGIIKHISLHVDSRLIPHFQQVMATSCPNVFHVECSIDSVFQY